MTVSTWLDHLRAQGLLRVRPLPLRDCPSWPWQDDAWRHVTGRYFSVVGMHAVMGGRALWQPMIDQPEVGVLGFVVRRPHAPQWLLQAKTEPGNVGGTQVGPSVQATESNYQRVHGGRPTPLINCFVGERPARVRLWADSRQSEQGDRFLGKYNRNALAEVGEDHPVPVDAPWRWFDAAEVRAALMCDYAVNTDARSVMVCSPWHWLSDDGQQAFSRWRASADEWGHVLWHSFNQLPGEGVQARIAASLAQARASWQVSRERVPLRDLPGWVVREDGIHPDGAPATFSVRAYDVTALDREVSHWAQPLVVGGRTAHISLMCARVDGVLKVWLREAPEPGFHDGVQLGPSDVDDPVHHRQPEVGAMLSAGIERAAVNQSDEGGRFMASVARYAVVEVSHDAVAALPDGDGGHWVTLSELSLLAQTPGMLTNEARSVASLLLAWA